MFYTKCTHTPVVPAPGLSYNTVSVFCLNEEVYLEDTLACLDPGYLVFNLSVSRN